MSLNRIPGLALRPTFIVLRGQEPCEAMHWWEMDKQFDLLLSPSGTVYWRDEQEKEEKA